MSVPLVWVDAFTAEPFRGNPAAVCLLSAPRPDAWHQAVASELGLSETAFLLAEGEGHRLRWFTPTTEVDLCGHATLASAHTLWSEGHLGADSPARFLTRSGPLSATLRDGWITLDFPADPVRPVAAPLALLEGLRGPVPLWTGRARGFYLAELAEADQVVALEPSLERIGALDGAGLIVTARAAKGASEDFVSRLFSPQLGVGEDPVTGSAHCVLGPYWGEKLGREELVGHQVSARGGRVRVRLAGGRALLSGQARTVLRGQLEV
ncbi:MAG: PhzF family phenazine biosynthesis protein [Planctomycetota bacterium]